MILPPSVPPPAAVLLADASAGEVRVAGLTVLDRLVICLHRAGLERITIVSKSPPVLPRSVALGIIVEHTQQVPQTTGEVLVANANLLVCVADLQRLLRTRGRLVDSEGRRLPAGVVDGLVGQDDWERRVDGAPEVRAEGLAVVVTSDSAKRAERAYWASLTSSSDGVVDRFFNRPAGRIFSRFLVHTSVTPNQVSLFATLVGLVAAGLFAAGTAAMALAGALTLQFSAVLDCVDGDLARALFKQSPLGKWLDIVGDQVVHVGVFLGIGIGLWRAGSAAPVLLLGSVAAAGVVISFLVVVRALLRPDLRGGSRLQKLIDATTNRDFSVLLILFALFDVLNWFLWLAAVGSHLFWVIAAALQLQHARNAELNAKRG